MARRCSTLCLPIDQGDYDKTVAAPTLFRAWIDDSFRLYPELFPHDFARGYLLKDSRLSSKLRLPIRRISLKSGGLAISVRPSFVLPHMTALAPDVRHPLFLRSFGVPFWAIAHVFGKCPMFWFRLELSLGRNSIVGTTLRRAPIPEHLLADEHHRTRDGEKNYVATVVGEGCCLGAALAETAGTDDLKDAYAAFKEEARDVQPGYEPETANVDGWAATSGAWRALFPGVSLILCFLHGWLAIRSRAKLDEAFRELSRRVWEAFRAKTRGSFSQRMRRAWEWAKEAGLSAWALEKVEKMCGRKGEYGEAYKHPGCHRTSNALDRVMRGMNRYFERGQSLHGSFEACDKHVRAWALLFNFRPWSPATTKANGGWRCPAERVNKHRYHDEWLQNLLISASFAGYHIPSP